MTENSNDQNQPKTSYQYIFKLIMIGNPNSGKTSLINRYVNNKFIDSYICTLGVDFFMKSIQIENTVVKFQIWDTAGMEKYRTIAASYFRGCHAAFVVFDLTSRESFEGVQKWIEAYNEQVSPMFKRLVILLGNKCDLIPQREISDEELDIFIKNNSVLYWPTSAKTGVGVEEAFTAVGKVLFDYYKNSSDETKSSIVIKKVHLEKKDFIGLQKNESKRDMCCRF